MFIIIMFIMAMYYEKENCNYEIFFFPQKVAIMVESVLKI